MKRIKKVLATALTMIMVLAMGMTAYAATVTIDDANGDTSEYSAYQLFTAIIDENGTDDESDDAVAYSVNSKYQAILAEITGKASSNDMVDYISALDTADAQRNFGDTVYAAIKEESLTADATTTSQSFELDPGYYLIVETTLGTNADGKPGTYSLVILDTAKNNNMTITTKEDVPTLVKKVQETNDTENTTTDWQDGADYDYGDAVPFKLTGTLPSNYASYKTYYYSFADKLAAGLTFDNSSVVVKVDGTKITSGYEVVTTGLSDGYTFEVRFANLKNITSVTADSTITVEYSATVNTDAVIGAAGNPNVAKLVYSNDPYYDGNGTESTSETPEDKVIVFTYQVTVNKVNTSGNPLKGAGFTLYKSVAGNYVAVGSEVKGDDITTFEFKGLDAGTYKLVESTVPTGFNKADDLIFEISAAYDTESDNPALTGVAAKDEAGKAISGVADAIFTISDGVFTVEIENVSGILLPTTGGIGTTIFYIVGAALMITAVVLLVAKKRKAN
ncbi:MAG: isopeptide-forming domain-containing fimbrial protein [Agathobacter sp.]|nr:isopeptide-forming domain-containing fimbrial protein [Agathobacter sp.]